MEIVRDGGMIPQRGKACTGLVKDAVMIIEREASVKLKASDVAAMLSVSVSSLSKRFKKEMHISVGRYIDGIVLCKVCQELRDSDIPVEVLAEKYGFCDRFYFSKRFKQLFQETPVEFRNHPLNGGDSAEE